MIKVTKVRSSALPGYADCARRSAARMFWEEIIAVGFTLNTTPRGIGSSVGTSVHAAAAMMLKEKMTTGSLTPVSACTDLAIDTYRVETLDGVLFDRETPASSVAEAQVRRMVEAYARVIAPQIEPIMVEERLEADTGYGIILTGQSDVLAREEGRLRDLKTGKKQSIHSAQLGAYSLLSKSHGYDVRTACVDFVQRVSAKSDQPDPVVTPYDIAQCETAAVNTLRHIAGDLQTFREGNEALGIMPGDAWAFAANPQSILCSAKFCPAFNSTFCHEHKKEAE